MASATTPPPSPPGSRRLLGLLLNTPEEATVHAVAVRDASSMSIFRLFVGWAVSLARPSTGEEKAEGTAPKIGGVASGKPVFSFGTESPSTASAPATASSPASEA
ncbi:hypothetical protein THAOC_21932 [Thalassiosira oceanica]|uniref:Uncharacterized protein n=1 Tax=Thalassiosira oceanica TaxID=159749 RepID=K0RZN8_THAOC|nr:hypothetical protein THAOC_21932 [Thalassiosira oceanica]|eukprot:EJK57979.1 hypothetical protein THAOC_21932 [Thalassiosira oceanica]